MSYRVIIAGGRDFDDYSTLREACDYYLRNKTNVEVVSGLARGADKLGVWYANERGLRVIPYPADWDTHGAAAGPIRNEEMASNAEALIAFWDGISRGTADMIEKARKRGLKVRVVRYGPEGSGMW